MNMRSNFVFSYFLVGIELGRTRDDRLLRVILSVEAIAERFLIGRAVS